MMKQLGWDTVRIKMPHLGQTFYGGNRYCSDHFKKSLKSFSEGLHDIDKLLADSKMQVAIENRKILIFTIC